MKKSTLVQLGLVILSASACDIESEDTDFYEEGIRAESGSMQHLTHSNAHDLLEPGKTYPIHIFARDGECGLQWDATVDEASGNRNAKWDCNPDYDTLYLNVIDVTDAPIGKKYEATPRRVVGSITMASDGTGILAPSYHNDQNLEQNARFVERDSAEITHLLLFDESSNGKHENPEIVNQIEIPHISGGSSPDSSHACDLQWNGGNPTMVDGHPERNAKWDCNRNSLPDQLDFWVGPAVEVI